MIKSIGILGGTFDPIHLAHLRMGLELYEMLNLDRVHFMPCYQPVHRELPVASPKARLEMVKCAIENEPAFHLDTRDIDRKGSSYFIDTLLDLRREMPDTAFSLLLGIDAFLGFDTWHRYQEILANAHIIVAHRPSYTLPKTGVIAELLQKH